MSNGFQLANTLMQLSSLKEQKAARKEEEDFRKIYVGPYMKAQKMLMDAQTDRAMDADLLEYEKRFKSAQTFGEETEAFISGERLDLLRRMSEGDEDDQAAARAYYLGIKENEGLRDQIAVMGVGQAEFRNQIALFGAQIQKDAFDLKQREFQIAVLLNPELRSVAKEELGKDGADAFRRKTIEEATGEKAVEKEERTVYERIRDLIMRKDQFPDEGVFSEPSRRKALPAAKPKPAPVKAPEKKAPSSTTLTTDESAAIFQKAQDNNINAVDIAAGVQKLVEMFPELNRDDVLSAHERLAEGFTVEELIDHYNEKKEK